MTIYCARCGRESDRGFIKLCRSCSGMVARGRRSGGRRRGNQSEATLWSPDVKTKTTNIEPDWSFLPADAHVDQEGAIWLRAYADSGPTVPVRVFRIGEDGLTDPERRVCDLKTLLEEEGIEACEGCGARAEGHDPKGLPLCRTCGEGR